MLHADLLFRCSSSVKVNISVYEGERTKTDDNHLLGEFTITGIERAKRGEAQIDVTFSIDSDGMLNVEAKDRKTGAKASIAITNAGRSSDKDIERMIKDAEKFRKADEEMVKRTEAVNDLEALIDSIAELTTEEPELNTEVLNRALEETQGWLEENRGNAFDASARSHSRVLLAQNLHVQLTSWSRSEHSTQPFSSFSVNRHNAPDDGGLHHEIFNIPDWIAAFPSEMICAFASLSMCQAPAWYSGMDH